MNTYTEAKRFAVIKFKAQYAVFFVSCVLTVYLILNPFIAPESVKNALSGCFEKLIPALFPFICISGVLTRAGFGAVCGKLMGKPFSAIFGLHPNGSSAYALGAVCGFPIGGRTALSVADENGLSRDEALILCALCNNPGIGFVICGVGAGMLGSVRAGMFLYLSNLAAAFAATAVMRLVFRIKVRSVPPKSSPENKKSTDLSVLSVIAESISDGSASMLKICGFAVFFTVLSDAAVNAFGAFPQVEFLRAAVSSFFEITAGTQASCELIRSGGALGRFLLFFSVGFGGMSAIMQMLSFSGEKLSAGRYILIKLVQGFFCSFLSFSF